ncbi:hypothetical protein GE061_019599 [Apolygus lucorum]|uniref:Uncharacterized protein n=1 Tax=Apolygus lucorum TaxID=248454 RepID=A0A8S9X8V3_APOLU|nr:hypothetical protein GE061_019599 [Apolygus lucorum]
MNRNVIFLICLFAVYQTVECGARRKRQTTPQIPQIANGELITSIFQVPIQTLGAVRDLLQTTRGRLRLMKNLHKYVNNVVRHVGGSYIQYIITVHKATLR